MKTPTVTPPSAPSQGKKKTVADNSFENVPVHEAADLFPLLDGAEFDQLVESIRRHGLREPIVRTADGKILDGRNRYRACLAAEVAPKYSTFRGPGTAFRYVIDLNLHRRHLTTSQRALIAAKIANLEQGARTDLAENSAMSQPEAAEALKVSRGSVQNAKKVIDNGTPELVQAVRDGALTVGAAVEAVDLPPDEQRDVVRQVQRGVKASTAIPQKKKTKTTAPKTRHDPSHEETPAVEDGAITKDASSDAISDTARELITELTAGITYLEMTLTEIVETIQTGHFDYDLDELTATDYPALGAALSAAADRLLVLSDDLEEAENELLDKTETA